MKTDVTATEHLESAKMLIHEEQGSIQIVGRPLTQQEQKRLDSLEAACVDIDGAILYLEGPGDEVSIELPADGRYNLSNDVLAVELRIDLETSNMVSGDVFAQANGHREYVASFRSEPGVVINNNDNPLGIVAEDVDDKRSGGTLAISSISGNEITMFLSFDNGIKALPIRQAVTLAGRFVDESMRELGIELESETGTDPMPTWDFDGRSITMETSFEEAGFNVFNVGFRNQFPGPSSGKWDTSELHGLMSQFAQEAMDRKSWNLHLLMVQQSTMNGLLGIMFDSGDLDLNQLPRQGAAVFQQPIRTRPDWQRKLIQTTVHELGHSLNLAHRFERPIGRANSTSFMNYDWKYMGGGNANKFWRDFSFTFDDDELAFLRHGPIGKVIPGGAEFHTVPYWENHDGAYVPYNPEVPSNDFRIKLVPPATGTLFDFAQPVLLTVELKNNSGRTLELPDFLLDPKAGFLELIIKRRTTPTENGSEQGTVFRPIIHRCFDMELAGADVVPHGGKLVNNVNLTFGSAGFTFIEPGEYEVTAVFVWQKAWQDIRTIKSNSLNIRIAYPKTSEEERDGQNLFRQDVGFYFALGGSDVLSDAENVLDEIVERRQGKAKTVKDPLVANIMRCKAINQSRDFILYSDGKYRTRAANPAKAREMFTSIKNVMTKVFDPQTAAKTTRLSTIMKRKMKK